MTELVISEAAEYLGIAVTTLRGYVYKGAIEPVRRNGGLKGLAMVFAKSDLDALKDSSQYTNPVDQTWKGRSAYFIRDKGFPDEDEVHPSGAIIYWSRAYKPDGYWRVPMKCASCGDVNDKHVAHLKQSVKSDRFTGCCKLCYAANRKPPRTQANYFRYTDGYKFLHRKTFTDDEWEIVKHMNPVNGVYISEHRAVMALHLGRPLLSTESVHHLNEIKDDNRLENLELHDHNSHPSLHANQKKQILRLRARIKTLEALLQQHGIELPK